MDCQPKSPFQSNPLLTAHDYSKSPMMEGCNEDEDEDMEDKDMKDEVSTCSPEAVPEMLREEGEPKPPPEDEKETQQALFSLSLSENKPEFNPQQTRLQEPQFFTPRDLLTLLRLETDPDPNPNYGLT